jgi:excinuclease ABC subunit B
MRTTIEATNYRREKQLAYNTKNKITPKAIRKSLENALTKARYDENLVNRLVDLAAESKDEYLTKEQLDKKIRKTRKDMESAAKELDFLMAAKFRDQIKNYQEQLDKL